MIKTAIALVGGLSPVVALLIGAVPALAIGWGAREAKFVWMDRPAIMREATASADAACAIRTMDAANRAEQAERNRQTAANADARRLYDEALNASQRAVLAAEGLLEKEIADHEAELVAEGRSCLLRDADIERLYGHGASGAD